MLATTGGNQPPSLEGGRRREKSQKTWTLFNWSESKGEDRKKLLQEREKAKAIKQSAASEGAGWRKKVIATVKEKGVVIRSWLLLRVPVGARKLQQRFRAKGRQVALVVSEAENVIFPHPLVQFVFLLP
ncbi:hypothetical protein M0R45_023865 [Rubus argutus]|uniref:Uncharacterized protein n=1 Tax=Rubus argutus TaxID=59490 RepID=A0AAW1WPB1_RUBAR